jgi:hypothetical protein
MYTQATSRIPDWVHEFRQWHVDMLAILTESQQSRVHLGGNWITFPYGEFDRLDPNFVVPLTPVLIPFAPHLRSLLAQFSATIVDEPLGPNEYRDLTGLSTMIPRTRSQTRALSTGKFLY